MQRPHEIKEVATRKCVWASRGNHAVEQFGKSVKHGSEEGANEADDGSSGGPVLLPLGEDVGSRWPSEAGPRNPKPVTVWRPASCRTQRGNRA